MADFDDYDTMDQNGPNPSQHFPDDDLRHESQGGATLIDPKDRNNRYGFIFFFERKIEKMNS